MKVFTYKISSKNVRAKRSYKMNKVRELKIDSTLRAIPSKLVNLFDFKPEKLSIEKVSDFNDDLNSIYYFKYDKNPFYLVINDLKGYFKEKDKKALEFIMEDQEQANIYNQIWNKIKKLINNMDGVNFGFGDYFRDRGFIKFHTDDTLPLDSMVNIYSMTIFIRSVYKTYYHIVYPQIYLSKILLER